MSDGMTLVQNEDGSFSAYDDTYDIVIHCETEEEQKKAIKRLKSTKLDSDRREITRPGQTHSGIVF